MTQDSTCHFLKALSDPTRLSVVHLIADQGELCVCELVEAICDEQPKISRHLALLKEQNVVVSRKHKQWMFYRINPKLGEWKKTIIQTLAARQPAYFVQQLNRLNSMGDRPSRQAACC